MTSVELQVNYHCLNEPQNIHLYFQYVKDVAVSNSA